jgi:hypothetical protein
MDTYSHLLKGIGGDTVGWLDEAFGHLEEFYRALGFPSEETRHRALLIYAAYAGTVRLFRDAPDRIPRGEDYLAYRRHLVDTLVPGDDTGDTGAR